MRTRQGTAGAASRRTGDVRRLRPWTAGLVAVLGAALLCGSPAAAQRVQTAVVPEAITVGDVFRAAIRIDLYDGARVIAPDSLELPADLEQAGRRDVRADTAAADGSRTLILVYPLTAWRPGSYTLPAVAVQVVDGDAPRTLAVQLPAFEVRSVLPADTAGIDPQPAKDVLGASRLWWPLLLALLVACAIAAAFWLWWRRRRRRSAVQPVPVAAPAVPPREAALARLDALRASGLLERGDVKAYYEVMTETLRHYAATVDPLWSVDLTTSELGQRMRATHMTEALELTRLLGAADLVKFARLQQPPEAAAADLDAARTWIEGVPPPVAEAASDAAEDRRVA
jgi:hypothetical protein